MSGPGFTRPGSLLATAATAWEWHNDRVRSGLDGYRPTAASSINRAIRLSTAAAMLAVAGIAA